jgi:hypothetical protein
MGMLRARNRKPPRKKARLAPKKKRPREWCSGGGSFLRKLTDKLADKLNDAVRSEGDDIAATVQSRTYIRCEVCNRRLKPAVRRPQEGHEDYLLVVPLHMAKG